MERVSGDATGHGSWATLPNSGRRTASAPTKTRSNPSKLRTRTKTSTELDLHISKLSPAQSLVPVHGCRSEGHNTIRQCFPLLRDCKVHPSWVGGNENLECSKSLVEVHTSAKPEMKMELKRYKKYVLEAQDQECVAATKLKEVEKQMAELEGTNLKLQDEVQLLEDKVEYLQESGPAAEPQPHNYTEMLKLKDKYIQKLGKETHAIRAEVTQLKSKYKKKLKEKTSQISEMRQLHCIQMMEIKTEMDKLMEENENLSDQLSRSDHGHASDMRNSTEGAMSKHDDRRTDVIVELSAKVSEQETRIIGLENKLFQREKHLNDLLDRTKSSQSKPDVEDGGDTRRRRDCDGPPTHIDRHCHSDVMMGDWEKRSSPQTHCSDSRLVSGRTHMWDEAPHDMTSEAKTKNKSPTRTAVHKGHAFNYMTSRCVQRNHAQSYSSGSDLSDNGEDDCWDDEDFSAGDKKSNGFHTSVNSAFYGVVEDSVGHGRHSHHAHSRKSTNKNQTNDQSATESPKLRHRQRNDSTAELTEPTGDGRHTARSHADKAHNSQ